MKIIKKTLLLTDLNQTGEQNQAIQPFRNAQNFVTLS
jgi:hypothetical protein